MRKAIITGITGQDGFYLASLLLSKGYEVAGIIRRSSIDNSCRLRYIKDHPNLTLLPGDVTDVTSIERAVMQVQPDEFYHLAAQSHVRESFDTPSVTAQITGIGTLNCLEVLRQQSPETRFYFAGSSEQFGNTVDELALQSLDERSTMIPRSPYACAKVFGYNSTRNHREAYKLFASNGILFNHESPLRGEMFVTRKITKVLAEIRHGIRDSAKFGNLDSERDWGFAGDYVRAMHAILQHDEPDDFVIGTGRSYSCRRFFELAADYAGVSNWESRIEIDPNLFRPTEVHVLVADPLKAEDKLGWRPDWSFDDLVRNMMLHDLNYYNPNYSSTERDLKCREYVGDALSQEVMKNG